MQTKEKRGQTNEIENEQYHSWSFEVIIKQMFSW